jgi:hypothetical protein
MGHVPDLYGVFKSSSFQKSVSEAASNLWDPHRYGRARIFFQMPSVLAPFTREGAKGVSVVFFANSALWLQWGDPAPEHKSERLTIQDGWFRMMIVPIVFKENTEQAGMLDCPVAAIEDASVKPAPGAGDPQKFLRREPTLSGRFLDTDAGGSLAIAWRDVSGEIRLTALRFADGKWKFGARECARPAGMEEKELYRLRIN